MKKQSVRNLKISLDKLIQAIILEKKFQNSGLKSSLQENLIFNLRTTNLNYVDSFPFKPFECGSLSDLNRGDYLIQVGEKVSFIIALQISTKKSPEIHIGSLITETFFKLAKKNLPFDLKLSNQILANQLKTFSFPKLRLEDRFKKELAFFFFQGRKWIEGDQIFSQFLNFGKSKSNNYNPFTFWGCIPRLIGFFLEKNFSKKSPELEKKIKNKKKNPLHNLVFDEWIINMILFRQIFKKRKVFVLVRFVLLQILRKNAIFLGLGSYRKLNKIGISISVQIDTKNPKICEEIRRLGREGNRREDNPTQEVLEKSFMENHLIRNFDISVKKLSFLNKVGKLNNFI